MHTRIAHRIHCQIIIGIISIFYTTTTMAAECDGQTYYTNCNTAKDYCYNGTCTPCPGNSAPIQGSGTFPASQYDCYRKCNTIPMGNGNAVPTSSHVQYGNNCRYKLECNNSEDECNGYHPSGDEYAYETKLEQLNCAPNKNENVTDDVTGHTGFQVWNGSHYEFYTKECGSNNGETYHFYTTAAQKCGHVYGECINNNGKCGDIWELSDYRGTDIAECDIATHNYTYNTTTQQYDFSACRCQTTFETYQGIQCAGNIECALASDFSAWTSDCKITNITSCDAGYCVQGTTPTNPYNEDGSLRFGKTPIGYYSDGETPIWAASGKTGTKCIPCPAGTSTSNTGATKKSMCHTSGGITEFCDGNNNCLKLPAGIQISYPDD